MCKNINYEKLADRMYELYVSKNYPFIIQKSDGTYEWKYDWGNLKDNKDILIRHLQSKQTVGVLCHSHTKFLCMDIDFKNNPMLAKWTTHKLVNILEEDFGFDNKFINVSYSGSKGYHILIFFNEVVSFKQIEYLYDLILDHMYYSIDYDSLDVANNNWNLSLEQLRDKIELRPKPNLGVKLELSVHQVTKNKCYFCDNITLEPIKSIEYLYDIQQCPREYIGYAIDYGNEIRKDRNNINKFNGQIKSRVKPTQSQNLYTDDNFTIDYIENLIENGLTVSGSRHNSLMKITRYYYHFGISKNECEDNLINWMLWQNKKFYNSDEIEWRKDIKKIVSFVYNNNRGINGKVRDITINKDEMTEILKHKERCKKILFYAFIVHAKRYAIKNGEFYMTYEQIMESTKLNKRTLIKYLAELEKDGEIEIVSRNKFSNNGYKKLPNKYIIKNKVINTNNNKENYIVEKDKNNYEEEYINNVINLFHKKEIKELLPNNQYRELSKLYA